MLDPSFSTDGQVDVPFERPYAAVEDVVVDARQAIVAAGFAGRGVVGWQSSDFAIARLLG